MWGVVRGGREWLSLLPWGGQWGGLGGEGGELGKRTSEPWMSQHRVPGLEHTAIQQVSSISGCFPSVGWIQGWAETFDSIALMWSMWWRCWSRGPSAGPLSVPDYIQSGPGLYWVRGSPRSVGGTPGLVDPGLGTLRGLQKLRSPCSDNSCISLRLLLSFSLGGCSICRDSRRWRQVMLLTVGSRLASPAFCLCWQLKLLIHFFL